MITEDDKAVFDKMFWEMLDDDYKADLQLEVTENDPRNETKLQRLVRERKESMV